ncbi:hypothetical protein SAY86_003160 [Trapa natans]|uniref:Histone deacetylase complex subunit SAP30 Sin3 binding domain-containing protein n=1 Tax=Trapa natans TaxID=22666 RepID=A0AAN7LVH1_TRANT|nr:hypothetical protein SAY86_003160 [Trapa natans]
MISFFFHVHLLRMLHPKLVSDHGQEEDRVDSGNDNGSEKSWSAEAEKDNEVDSCDHRSDSSSKSDAGSKDSSSKSDAGNKDSSSKSDAGNKDSSSKSDAGNKDSSSKSDDGNKDSSSKSDDGNKDSGSKSDAGNKDSSSKSDDGNKDSSSKSDAGNKDRESTSSSEGVDGNETTKPREQDPGSARRTAVDLSKLKKDSLRRYCRKFNLMRVTRTSSKEEMLRVVKHHFESVLRVDEEEEIVNFIHATSPKSPSSD